MQAEDTIRVAFGSVPKDGGTFTFYRNMRPALRRHGIDLRCVTIGAEEARLREPAYADEGCHLLAPRSFSLRHQARAFTDWCKQEDIHIAIGVNSAAILSALPHLPQRVRLVARCANAFDHGYRITLSGGDRLMRIIALSPRLRDDLVTEYGADPDRLVLIPNGIEPGRFASAAGQARGQAPRLELGFLGRLEHGQKGVMHLPAIVDALHDRKVDFRLCIAGKGRDGDALRGALAAHEAAGRVQFVGALAPDEIPPFLAETDIFVFTSRFEGMPNALLEAMMAGCVPVCFSIDGITDAMIDDGRTGYLVAQEDADGFADRVAALDRDRAALDRMHVDGAASARAGFAIERTAEAYAALFRTVMQEPAPAIAPRDWRDFEPDPNFPQTWRRFVPPGLKAAAKKALR